MGKDRAAEARAAEARETARQFDELRKRADKISYDKDEVLENLKIASEQIPELVGLYEAAKQDPSALEDIATNPRYSAIQEGNLEEMQEMAEESGFSEADMAKRRAIERQASASDSARQKSIVQDMMARGQAGSGTELLARLGSSQAATQRQAEAGDRLAMDSATARKQALANASQQAGNLRQQSYGEQSNLANARDQIAQFNAMNRTNTANRNLDLRQGQENQRSGQKANYYANVANTEQQRFANEMSKLGLQSNMIGNAGQARMAGVAPNRPGVGGMIGTAIGAGVGAMSGTPQGASAGAAIGGSIGNASGYKDGGIRHKYSGNNKFNNIAPSPQGNFGIPGIPQQPPMSMEPPYSQQLSMPPESTLPPQDNLVMARQETDIMEQMQGDLDKTGLPRIKEREQYVTEKDTPLSELPEVKEEIKPATPKAEAKEEGSKKEDNAAMLKNLQQIAKNIAPKKEAPVAPIKYAQEKINVQSMPGFKVEDGGVKPSTDDMRDQLLGQIQAFAEGGVKYEDGGVSKIDDELIQATQMLRTNNQPAPGAPMPGGQPPMPQAAPPMPPQGMPMPPQGMPPQEAPMPPQQPPMPPQGMPMPPQGMPQGQAMADGGMAYEDGGEGTIIDSGMDMYEGDQLPDRINDGEMVLNVEQQDRLNDALMELKRLKSRERTDKMLAKGEIEANPMQQESLMSFVRGEIDIDEVPNERVVKEPSMGEPSGRMAELLGMVSKKRRG